MSTPQSAPTAPPGAARNVSPNQYHLRGYSIQISYYPDGEGPLTTEGPVILTYSDGHQSIAFRGKQADVVPVANLGTCVTVTLQLTPDLGSTTATLLVPTVVLVPGQSTTIQTELITTVHPLFITGLGPPQRDNYTVIPLTGEASVGPLAL